MKTKLLLLASLFPFPFFLFPCEAQVPQGFNYQAIARDPSNGNNPITGATMQVKIGILSDTIANTMVWEELFNPVKTNAFGMFTIVVGTGLKQSGSATSFSAIDWTKMPLFLRTSIYYPSSWKIMGTTKLQSVPYSMVAGNLEGNVPLLSIKGNTTTMDSALFVVRNNTGQIVFAVYNEGVRIYVDDGVAKGATKGGFAIGSFDRSKGTSQPLFVVDPDSIRGYIAPTTGKAIKGGFAIGGFDPSKTVLGEEYLRVTRDSSRIYVLNPAKGVKGGFAIGGFDPSKGGIQTPFTSLTLNNYLIGERSGGEITSGLYNSFLGYETGMNNTSGSDNVFLGYHAGLLNDTASYNVFVGNEAGNSNRFGEYNSYIGYQSGYSNVSGMGNVFVGYKTGYSTTSKANNFIGYQAGFSNITGVYNVFIGYKSGMANTIGGYNVFIGDYAGYSNIGGSGDVMIGLNAGNASTSGVGNIFIGERSGYFTTSDDNIFIGLDAGTNNNSGQHNLFMGYEAGHNNSTGSSNVIIGDQAGVVTSLGNNNLILGAIAGYTNAANNNIFLGYESGYNHTTGDGNTFLGVDAGKFNFTGSNNVFIGNGAGYSEAGSNKLYINNSTGNASQALIYGEFDNRQIALNASVGINTISPSQNLDVNGNARFRSIASGTFANTLNVTSDGTLTLATSDIRMKENINQITNALEKVNGLRGVTFTWKNDSTKTKQIGMIAQEVEPVVPEIVFTNPVDGLKGINYSQASALFVEAIKEQQKKIESQQKEIDELKILVNTLVANQTGQGNK